MWDFGITSIEASGRSAKVVCAAGWLRAALDMALGDDDALGLVSGDAGASASRDEPPKKKAKNTQLRHWELPPGQLLNPMGQSGVGKLSAQTLWELLAKGGEKSAFYCNLCSEDHGSL